MSLGFKQSDDTLSECVTETSDIVIAEQAHSDILFRKAFEEGVRN